MATADFHLAVALDGTGWHPTSWREPEARPGDLFAAAYVWADHWGAALEQRLRWSVLYASLSVRVATAVAGAVTLRALLEEGAGHGLTSPVRQPAAMKEDQ